jgi:hypothetical protein
MAMDRNSKMKQFRSINKVISVEKFKDRASDEGGSLSLLIIALFLVALSALMITTNIAVVANAKRSLDHVTEAAAMRAVHTLDEKSYYVGKHTLLTTAMEIANNGNYAENRVPIDCDQGRAEVFKEFEVWNESNTTLKTLQITDYSIDAYECEFDVVSLQSSAIVKLPFPSPFGKLQSTKVNSSISTLNEKDKGLYLLGIRIH